MVGANSIRPKPLQVEKILLHLQITFQNPNYAPSIKNPLVVI